MLKCTTSSPNSMEKVLACTSIYRSLHVGDLKPAGVVIHLANRSVVIQLGVIENVLVRVKDLIFPADFNILDIEKSLPAMGLH